MNYSKIVEQMVILRLTDVPKYRNMPEQTLRDIVKDIVAIIDKNITNCPACTEVLVSDNACPSCDGKRAIISIFK
jgi:hypothetical protein